MHSIRLIAALLYGAAQICSAQAPLPTESLQACVNEKNDARRLSCYDKAMARPAVPPNQTFGMTAEQRLATVEPASPAKMTAIVAEVHSDSEDRLYLRLDNGQTWIERPPIEYFPVKAGDAVTITKGLMGAFMMSGSSAGHRTIRVKRDQ